MTLRRTIVGVCLIAAAIGAWYLVVAIDLASRLIVPTPGATFSALRGILRSGDVLRHEVLTTVETIAIGFSLAVVVGVGLGLLIGRNKVLTAAYEPLIASLTTIPIIVLYPMLVGALGVSQEPKVLVAFISAVLPILLASISAARHVEPRLLVAMHSLGAGAVRTTLSITLPACLPRIFTGLRAGLGLCGVTVVAGEYIASLGGLGYQLAQSSESLQTPSLYAWVVVTLVVMALLNLCLGLVQFTVERGVKR